MSQSTTISSDLSEHWTLGIYALPQQQCDSLAQTRSLLAGGNPSIRACVRQLQNDAEAFSNLPLLSVIDDPTQPPSGDMRDYTSLGTYWWPNPDTADGLPYVRRDGERNPETLGGDLSIMTDMIIRCCVLILAWRLTDNERFIVKAIEQIRHFFLAPETAMNPHLKYAQRIPGRCDGRGIGLIDTARLLSLIELLPLLRDATQWSDADEQGMQQWVRQYLDWFENSDLGREERQEHNNHGTWHDAQAVGYALYTNQPDRARAVLKNVPGKRIDQHIAADGSQPHEQARTLSLSYSMFNLEALFALAIFAQRVNMDLWQYKGPQGQNLLSTINYLAVYAGRFSDWPYPQIKAASEWRLATLLQIAHRYYGNPLFAQSLNAIASQTPAQRFASLIYGL